MSELVKRLVGAYLPAVPTETALAQLVEDHLKGEPAIGEFLKTLPEQPPLERLHVVKVTDEAATCVCPFVSRDHESVKFLHAELRVEVTLANLRCRVLW